MRIVTLSAAAALCGCVPVMEKPESAEVGLCDAAPVQDLLGRPADEVRADARRRSGARTVRVYGPGNAVTMDYREDRLNLQVDEKGLIVTARCG